MPFLKDWFIPHEGNNHHPHALRHHVLAGYSVALIVVKILAVFLPIALPWTMLFSSAVTPANILSLTNQAREAHGLDTLTPNVLLTRAAQAKAEDMLAHQYFAHQSPQGLTPWDFIRQTGYTYLYGGENLAVHYSSAEDVQGGWMLSPTHRANVLNVHYQDIGVGVSYGNFEGTSTIFVVQMFGTPSRTELDDAPVVHPAIVRTSKLSLKAEPTKVVVKEQAASVTTTQAVLGVAESDTATVVSNSRSDQLDAFREGGAADHGFQDGVRMIYLLVVVFLTCALFINIALRLQIQHASILAHTMGVIGLAVCLALV